MARWCTLVLALAPPPRNTPLHRANRPVPWAPSLPLGTPQERPCMERSTSFSNTRTSSSSSNTCTTNYSSSSSNNTPTSNTPTMSKGKVRQSLVSPPLMLGLLCTPLVRLRPHMSTHIT